MGLWGGFRALGLCDYGVTVGGLGIELGLQLWLPLELGLGVRALGAELGLRLEFFGFSGYS